MSRHWCWTRWSNRTSRHVVVVVVWFWKSNSKQKKPASIGHGAFLLTVRRRNDVVWRHLLHPLWYDLLFRVVSILSVCKLTQIFHQSYSKDTTAACGGNNAASFRERLSVMPLFFSFWFALLFNIRRCFIDANRKSLYIITTISSKTIQYHLLLAVRYLFVVIVVFERLNMFIFIF